MSDKKFIIEQYDTGKTYFRQKKFDCGNKIINKFVHSSLKKQISQHFSQAYVLLDTGNSECFSAFYTLASFKLSAPELDKLSQGSLPRDIPCVRLVMLGVDKSLQGQGIGKKMLEWAIERAKQRNAHLLQLTSGDLFLLRAKWKYATSWAN